MRTSAPSANGEESREAAWNWHGDLTFLMPHKQVPEVPIVTREEPQVSCCNLRKTRSFSPQCEMRPFSSTASREIPPSLLSLKRVLDTIDATHKIPRHTRLHLKGTPNVPPLLKESPVFLSSSRDDGPIPCFVGKGIPAFLSHLKRR